MSTEQNVKLRAITQKKMAAERKKYVIEKGIIIPPFYLAQLKKYTNRHNVRPSQYPFHDMEVGDSFLTPPGKSEKNFRMVAATYGSRYNMKFVVTRDSNYQIRCWRMA